MIRYDLLQEASAHVWAMHEPALDALCADLIAGRESLAQSDARIEIIGNVAIVPVSGVIVPKGSRFVETHGLRSTQNIRADIQAALDDDSVNQIILDVDSPGGIAVGLMELGDFIFKARQVKPITAVTNHLNASAAFYITSQATRVVSTPSGETGGIGVFTRHIDISRMLEAQGVTVTLISAGENKTEGNMFEPLSEKARDRLQQMVNEVNNDFVAKVARGRRVSAAKVNESFGQGRLLTAEEALEVGMIDAIQTPDEIVGHLVESALSPVRRMAARTALESIRFGEINDE